MAEPSPSNFIPPQNQPAAGVTNDHTGAPKGNEPFVVTNGNEPVAGFPIAVPAAGVPIAVNYRATAAPFLNNQFNANDPKYKCCCGCMHAKNGTLTIEILGILAFTGLGIFLIFNGESISYSSYGVTMPLTIIVIISLAIGMATKKGGFLVPYMVFRLMFLGAVYAFSIFAIVYLNSEYSSHGRYRRYSGYNGYGGNYGNYGNQRNDRINEKPYESPTNYGSTFDSTKLGITSGFLAFCFFETIYVFWAIHAVFKCYIYFNDLNQHEQRRFVQC